MKRLYRRVQPGERLDTQLISFSEDTSFSQRWWALYFMLGQWQLRLMKVRPLEEEE